MTKQTNEANGQDAQTSQENAVMTANDAAFQKALEAAIEAENKGKTTQDLSNTPLLKFEIGEKRIVYFTGEFQDVLFSNAGAPKRCPVFKDADGLVKLASDAVLVSTFNKHNFTPSFFSIEATGKEKNSSGSYTTFAVKQINL